MKIIVTCGPSSEPIDQVRRITNFSTGELGVLLCEELTRAGFAVLCCKGSGATHPGPSEPCQVRLFQTNDDLLALLEEAGAAGDVSAVFHAAALCDYRVKRVSDEQGRDCHDAKISSRAGTLTLTLEPATKVIARMREIFPRSLLVGWKYELVGTREAALEKGRRQMEENQTDGCVVNGAAFGNRFILSRPGHPQQEYSGKRELVTALAVWLSGSLPKALRLSRQDGIAQGRPIRLSRQDGIAQGRPIRNARQGGIAQGRPVRITR